MARSSRPCRGSSRYRGGGGRRWLCLRWSFVWRSVVGSCLDRRYEDDDIDKEEIKKVDMQTNRSPRALYARRQEG